MCDKVIDTSGWRGDIIVEGGCFFEVPILARIKINQLTYLGTFGTLETVPKAVISIKPESIITIVGMFEKARFTQFNSQHKTFINIVITAEGVLGWLYQHETDEI
jgi:hypothetical protein